MAKKKENEEAKKKDNENADREKKREEKVDKIQNSATITLLYLTYILTNH